MIHLRLRVPTHLTDTVSDLLCDDDTVVNIAVIPGAYRQPEGCLMMADVARESAQSVLASLRELGLGHDGAITVSEGDTVVSDAANQAERAAPGSPVDGVVWDIIEDHAREDIRLSWSFVAFLTLATMIAGVGRLLDQPILIVGAMVVGPEFAPVAAICFALARPRVALLPRAVGTLIGGMAIAAAVASTVWSIVHLFGGFTNNLLQHRPATDFIVHPDVWSFVIALLAGVAGALSLTTSKSATLVGVFISVTTVPAIGTLSLSVATTNWEDARSSLIQLGVNLAGLILAGTVTLLIQRFFWSRVSRHRTRDGSTA